MNKRRRFKAKRRRAAKAELRRMFPGWPADDIDAFFASLGVLVSRVLADLRSECSRETLRCVAFEAEQR